MDVRLGRSRIKSFMSLSPSIFNEQESLSLPASAQLPNLIEFNCGRSIYQIIQIIQILDIIVDNG